MVSGRHVNGCWYPSTPGQGEDQNGPRQQNAEINGYPPGGNDMQYEQRFGPNPFFGAPFGL